MIFLSDTRPAKHGPRRISPSVAYRPLRRTWGYPNLAKLQSPYVYDTMLSHHDLMVVAALCQEELVAVRHLPTAFDMEGFGLGVDRHVYLEMAFWADKRGLVRVSQQELAERCVISRATVARSLAALTQLGFIKKVGHGRYALILERDDTNRRTRKVWDWLRSRDEEVEIGGTVCFTDPLSQQDERMIQEATALGVLVFKELEQDGEQLWHMYEAR